MVAPTQFDKKAAEFSLPKKSFKPSHSVFYLLFTLHFHSVTTTASRQITPSPFTVRK